MQKALKTIRDIKTWEPIPELGNVKTAYDLLTRIKEIIRERPTRYHQGEWRELFRESSVESLVDNHTDSYINSIPLCGTQCCVGGWAVALVRPRLFSRMGYFEVADTAQQILGLTGDQADELFDGDALTVSNAPGTKAYAEAGCDHISAFQKKYKKQLQARILPLRKKKAA